MRERSVVALLLAAAAWLLIATLSRPSPAQVGGGSGPMPRHFPHAAPTPPPSAAGPGRIRLTLPDGDGGPVTLAPKNGGFVGEFVVWNDGPGPLTVSRVALRSDEDDPRLPPRFTARFSDGGGGSGLIQSHSSKRVTITWIPDHEPKLHEAGGHVVLTSNDEVAGEVAMGFVAPLPGVVSPHLLTWMLLLPLGVAATALAMRVVGYARAELLRGLTLAATALQCVLAVVLYEGFNGAVTRVDGNDGFQFVERAVLSRALGVEYFVGVDGVSVSLVLLTAVVGFAGAILAYRVAPARGLPAFYGLFGLLLAASLGVFVALDLAVFAASWALTLASVALLVASSGPSARAAATKVTSYAVASASLVIVAIALLHFRSDPTFLVDGTRVSHSFAIPELMRVAYNAKHLEILGVSWVKVVWVTLFLGFAVAIPLVPFHRWLIAAVSEAPAPVGVVVAAVVVRAGVYGILRVSVGLLPDGSRWASTTVVALAVVTVLFGAVAATRDRSLRPLVVHLAVSQAGLSLVGLGAMTREGIAGCLVQMTSGGVAIALLLTLVAVVHDRLLSGDLDRLAGLRASMPYGVTALAVAALALVGMPGLSGFWGAALSLLGAFPVQRWLSVAAVVGTVVAAVAAVRGVASFARPAPSRTTSAAATDDLLPREIAAVVPLLVLTLALGLSPAPFFTLVRGGIADLNQLVNPPGPDEVASVAAPRATA